MIAVKAEKAWTEVETGQDIDETQIEGGYYGKRSVKA
jgi:hypothetical protein